MYETVDFTIYLSIVFHQFDDATTGSHVTSSVGLGVLALVATAALYPCLCKRSILLSIQLFLGLSLAVYYDLILLYALVGSCFPISQNVQTIVDNLFSGIFS